MTHEGDEPPARTIEDDGDGRVHRIAYEKRSRLRNDALHAGDGFPTLEEFDEIGDVEQCGAHNSNPDTRSA